MNSKEYFEQAYRLKEEIDCKIAQLAVLNALSTKTTSALSGMPHAAGHEGSKLEDTIVKIVDLQEEINADIDRLVDLKGGIGQMIALVEDKDQRLILELRYLCWKPWDEIEVRMNLSKSGVYYLKINALKSFEKIFLKNEIN